MNRKAYNLDLQTVLDYLSAHGESCVLSTTLKERGRTGYVIVRKGAMVTCYIKEGERTIMEGEPAFKTLARYDEWHVQLQEEPQITPPTLPHPPHLSSPLSTNSRPLPAINTGYLDEQSPSLHQGFSSGQLPALRRGNTSGHWPVVNPNSLNGRWANTDPGFSSGQLPITRPGFPLGWLPRIRRTLSQEEIMAFPARQRMVIRLVLTMVNGARSVEEIKAQLQLSPETVENALMYLRVHNVIE